MSQKIRIKLKSYDHHEAVSRQIAKAVLEENGGRADLV